MAGSEDGKVFIWDLLTSKLLWKGTGHRFPLLFPKFSPEKKNNIFFFFSFPLLILSSNRGTITSVSSHPRSPCAVSTSLDSTICVWEE